MSNDDQVRDQSPAVPGIVDIAVSDDGSSIGTKRKLDGRHLQMIAIGGTIGAGLFIKSGDLIAGAGALGALIAYTLAGLSVMCVVMSLGEMATLIPISGSFNAYAERFVDPALGFTAGWSYWLQWCLTLPLEVQVAVNLLRFWLPDWNPLLLSLAILLLILALNLFSVKGYGEAEYWLSILKVLAIVIFIIACFTVVFRDHLGFSNWNHPDMFAGNGPVSILSTFVPACFAFGGTELVGITAGEAKNPRESVPRAINGTFWRIMIFYILSILVIGLLLPADYLQELLDSEKNALLRSPFVLGFAKAGIPAAPDIMNFVAFIAVFSAGNSSVYASSRTMMALCHSGHGPAFLGKTTKGGVPLNAILITALFGCISFSTSLIGEGMLFDLLVDMIGLFVIVTWIMISWAHIRFRNGYVAQGYEIKDLPFISRLGTTGDYVGITMFSLIILFSGTSGLLFDGDEFDAILFIRSYFGLLVYPILYFSYKWKNNTKIVPLLEIDFETANINGHDPVEKEPTYTKKWMDFIA